MAAREELPHVPVLVQELINGLGPKDGGKYVDGTLGAGGHAASILEASAPGGKLLGLDWDEDALEVARRKLERYGDRITLVKANFRQLEAIAAAHGFVPANGVILDLGLSSMQLLNPRRGFSFAGETLDIRMDRSEGTSAQELVNNLPESELANIIFRYGEERSSRRIARHIVSSRPITSAKELAGIIERAVPRRGRLHPATKTFQALRIAVNHELENLESVLPQLTRVTSMGGRVAIITFHSLEDRRVKEFFKKDKSWQNLTKHPIKPTRAEISANPRSRSAKLRIAERL